MSIGSSTSLPIAGFVKNSFVDFPGVIAAVVFTPGCNMRCFYCHNKRLLRPVPEAELINEQEVIDHLLIRRELIEGLVITGGEPTLQPQLAAFIRRVKGTVKGIKIKLDTNGSNPAVLKQLLDEHLIDFIAMDIKAPIEKYAEFCGAEGQAESVLRCIDIIEASGVARQYRTTLAPGLTDDDVQLIRKLLPAGAPYVTQAYREPEE